jgi:ankyrin repeat protein
MGQNKSAARLAYSKGYIECLKLLAAANARDSRELLVHEACKANDIELLRAQLSSYPAAVNAIDPMSRDTLVQDTLVHVACRDNRPEMLSVLVEFNADLDVLTRGNESAARLAYSRGYIECLKLLAEANAKDSRELLAHAACKANDMDLLRAQLSRNPAVVNAIDPLSGDALVHVACRDNRPEMLSLLVECEADLEVLTRSKKTASRLAYVEGCIDCLKLLAEANARGSRELLAHEAFKADDMELLRAQLSSNPAVVNAINPLKLSISMMQYYPEKLEGML